MVRTGNVTVATASAAEEQVSNIWRRLLPYSLLSQPCLRPARPRESECGRDGRKRKRNNLSPSAQLRVSGAARDDNPRGRERGASDRHADRLSGHIITRTPQQLDSAVTDRQTEPRRAHCSAGIACSLFRQGSPSNTNKRAARASRFPFPRFADGQCVVPQRHLGPLDACALLPDVVDLTA